MTQNVPRTVEESLLKILKLGIDMLFVRVKDSRGLGQAP